MALVSSMACAANVGGSDEADAGVDVGVDGGMVADAGPTAPAPAPEIYPTDRSLSPITPYVAANIRAIAARDSSLRNDVFAKVGASATVSFNFMHCFASANVDVDGRDYLTATVAYFLGGSAGGINPYERTSLTATVGWSAGAALSGDPSPLQEELAAISPRYALVMYGTNDIQLGNIDAYGRNLLDVADLLVNAGVIPVFTTIMPRDDSASADLEVPRYNAVVRAVAQAYQVPFADFHRELLPLPDHGVGSDGIHPTVYRDGGARGCVFTPVALTYGYNIRNLLSIESLHRLNRILDGGEAAPDVAQASVTGAGAPSDPVLIAQLPFSDLRDTSESPNDNVDVYDGCSASQDESGPEYVYRLVLDRTTTIRARVVSRAGVDVDVHLLQGGSEGSNCLMRNNKVIVTQLDPGTYFFNIDTFVNSGGTALPGEFLFVVTEE